MAITKDPWIGPDNDWSVRFKDLADTSTFRDEYMATFARPAGFLAAKPLGMTFNLGHQISKRDSRALSEHVAVKISRLLEKESPNCAGCTSLKVTQERGMSMNAMREELHVKLACKERSCLLTAPKPEEDADADREKQRAQLRKEMAALNRHMTEQMTPTPAASFYDPFHMPVTEFVDHDVPESMSEDSW